MSRWDKLSMRDRAELMKIYVKHGLHNLDDIRKHYNSFDGGGEVDNVNTTEAQDYVATWLSQRQEQLRENVRHNSQRFLLPKSWSNKATFNEYQRQLKNLQSVKQYDVLGNTSFPQAPKEEWEAVKRLTTNVGGAYNPKTHSISYINPTSTTDIHELTHSLDAEPQINAIRYPNIQGEMLREGVKYNSYYDSAPEIYPRLMEFRKNFNLDPKRTYTPEDIKKFREKYDSNNILNRYSDEYIEHLLNNVASIKSNRDVKNIADNGGVLLTKEGTERPIISSIMTYTNPYSEFLEKVSKPTPYKQIPLEKDGSPVGFREVTKDIQEGSYYLYPKKDQIKYWDNMHHFIKDKDSGRVYEQSYIENSDIDLSSFDNLSYPELKQLLPRKDYIGGRNGEDRIKALRKMPKVISYIKDAAKRYGIDENVMFHRFLREGYIDQNITEYNERVSAKDQKDFWDKLPEKSVNGFMGLGLDHAGTNLINGVYTTKRPINYSTITGINENQDEVLSIATDNLWDALEVNAADMAWRKRLLEKRGINSDLITTYINAAYNLGENHKDLKNQEFIKRTYTVPNYNF